MEIRILKNGPFHIKGKFIFKDSTGKTYEKDEIFLCSCGGSKIKPFCDCSHEKASKAL